MANGVVRKFVDVSDAVDIKIKQLTTNKSIVEGRRILEAEIIVELIEKGLKNTSLHIKK